MKALEVRNLEKIYEGGVKALKGVDMHIEKGDFFALLGANGAGKTTLIGILAGLVRKTGGTASIYGYDIDREHDDAKKMIGLVPQEFNFNIFEKVMDIVTQQAGYYGVPHKVACRRAEQIFKQLDLWGKKDVPSRTLSGGMKRRLMIARALIHEPKVLILDEPTAGVDVEMRHSTWDYLRGLNRAGTTILLTTHYLEEAEELCRNVAIIKKGEIVKTGGVKKLIGSLDKQTYIVTVNKIGNGNMAGYDFRVVDENTIEVDLGMHLSVSDLINMFSGEGIKVQDIHPKGNRLEQLFLHILKS